jgi:hypothetical protein
MEKLIVGGNVYDACSHACQVDVAVGRRVPRTNCSTVRETSFSVQRLHSRPVKYAKFVSARIILRGRLY